MISHPKRRLLPRFGLRTLFVVVLIVAVYFGSWPWFREIAIRDVESAGMHRLGAVTYVGERKSDPLDLIVLAPFLVSVIEDDAGGIGRTHPPSSRRRYYLWLFGWTAPLPITNSHRENVVEREPIGTSLEDWGRKDTTFLRQPPIP